MCFSHNVQRTVHHHALTQGIGLHPRKLTWPIKKENCTYYLKMAIFPIAILFYWERNPEIFHHPTHFGSPVSEPDWWFCPRYHLSLRPKIHISFTTWFWLGGGECCNWATISWGAQDGARMGCESSRPMFPNQNNRNHICHLWKSWIQKCGKGYVSSQENKMWVGVSALRALGIVEIVVKQTEIWCIWTNCADNLGCN